MHISGYFANLHGVASVRDCSGKPFFVGHFKYAINGVFKMPNKKCLQPALPARQAQSPTLGERPKKNTKKIY